MGVEERKTSPGAVDGMTANLQKGRRVRHPPLHPNALVSDMILCRRMKGKRAGVRGWHTSTWGGGAALGLHPEIEFVILVVTALGSVRGTGHLDGEGVSATVVGGGIKMGVQLYWIVGVGGFTRFPKWRTRLCWTG